MEITVEEIDRQITRAKQEHAEATAQIEELTKIQLRAEGAFMQLTALRNMLTMPDVVET